MSVVCDEPHFIESSKDFMCPGECSYLSFNDVWRCIGICTVKDKCSLYNPFLNYADEETKRCLPCLVSGCVRCVKNEKKNYTKYFIHISNNLPNICLECMKGYKLSQDKTRCTLIYEEIITTICNLLLLSSFFIFILAMIYYYKNFYRINFLLYRLIYKYRSFSKFRNNKLYGNPLYPLSLNLTKEDIGGIGIMLYFRCITFLSFVSLCFMFTSFLDIYLPFNDLIQTYRNIESTTSFENCSNLKKYISNNISRLIDINSLDWMSLDIFNMVYNFRQNMITTCFLRYIICMIITFLFIYKQKHFSIYKLRQTNNMSNFSLFISNIPTHISTNDIKKFFEKLIKKKGIVVGISPCYNFLKKKEQVFNLIEEQIEVETFKAKIDNKFFDWGEKKFQNCFTQNIYLPYQSHENCREFNQHKGTLSLDNSRTTVDVHRSRPCAQQSKWAQSPRSCRSNLPLQSSTTGQGDNLHSSCSHDRSHDRTHDRTHDRSHDRSHDRNSPYGEYAMRKMSGENKTVSVEEQFFREMSSRIIDICNLKKSDSSKVWGIDANIPLIIPDEESLFLSRDLAKEKTFINNIKRCDCVFVVFNTVNDLNLAYDLIQKYKMEKTQKKRKKWEFLFSYFSFLRNIFTQRQGEKVSPLFSYELLQQRAGGAINGKGNSDGVPMEGASFAEGVSFAEGASSAEGGPPSKVLSHLFKTFRMDEEHFTVQRCEVEPTDVRWENISDRRVVAVVIAKMGISIFFLSVVIVLCSIIFYGPYAIFALHHASLIEKKTERSHEILFTILVSFVLGIFIGLGNSLVTFITMLIGEFMKFTEKQSTESFVFCINSIFQLFHFFLNMLITHLSNSGGDNKIRFFYFSEFFYHLKLNNILLGEEYSLGKSLNYNILPIISLLPTCFSIFGIYLLPFLYKSAQILFFPSGSIKKAEKLIECPPCNLHYRYSEIGDQSNLLSWNFPLRCGHAVLEYPHRLTRKDSPTHADADADAVSVWILAVLPFYWAWRTYNIPFCTLPIILLLHMIAYFFLYNIVNSSLSEGKSFPNMSYRQVAQVKPYNWFNTNPVHVLKENLKKRNKRKTLGSFYIEKGKKGVKKNEHPSRINEIKRMEEAQKRLFFLDSLRSILFGEKETNVEDLTCTEYAKKSVEFMSTDNKTNTLTRMERDSHIREDNLNLEEDVNKVRKFLSREINTVSVSHNDSALPFEVRCTDDIMCVNGSSKEDLLHKWKSQPYRLIGDPFKTKMQTKYYENEIVTSDLTPLCDGKTDSTRKIIHTTFSHLEKKKKKSHCNDVVIKIGEGDNKKKTLRGKKTSKYVGTTSRRLVYYEIGKEYLQGAQFSHYTNDYNEVYDFLYRVYLSLLSKANNIGSFPFTGD
ncbi:probable protein, unknown function [Plasmodium ovale wallikeri]|uniref:Uncharacterized protein n=1 Tax=Plasmodium ovale wallikeri TaxID=864142 RepID=A0A1A8ZW00_PLAOA|nr:probable protein, unknown function [Plasmodium ovale wallikeri]SBT48525.1 probable protein, unknown function [Plasmodium ovale wallikeri]